jgi:hypothetical protein
MKELAMQVKLVAEEFYPYYYHTDYNSDYFHKVIELTEEELKQFLEHETKVTYWQQFLKEKINEAAVTRIKEKIKCLPEI